MEFGDEIGCIIEIFSWLPGGANIVVAGPLHVILQLLIPYSGVDYPLCFPFWLGGVVDNHRIWLGGRLACSWRPIFGEQHYMEDVV